MIGRSFKGLCKYLMSKVDKGQGEILDSRGVREDLQGMITDFNSGRMMNEKLKRCVGHTSLSFGDDKLTDKQMVAITHDWMKIMGMDQTQHVIIKHTDTHFHVHVAYSRVSDLGITISDSNNYMRSEAACRELEIKYNLKHTPSIRNEEKINHDKLKGRDKVKSEMNFSIQDCLRKAKSIEEFNLLMKKEKKIECMWTYYADASPRGLIFGFENDENIKIKASAIHRFFSAGQIDAYFEKKKLIKQKHVDRVVKNSLHELKNSVDEFVQANSEYDYSDGVMHLEKLLNIKQRKHGRHF